MSVIFNCVFRRLLLHEMEKIGFNQMKSFSVVVFVVVVVKHLKIRFSIILIGFIFS